jgi:hypothetical protein
MEAATGRVDDTPSAPPIARADDLPSREAAGLSAFLLVAGLVLAAVAGDADGFAPRIATIDALAGLVVGAFVVDRLLTFIPAWMADDAAAKRTRDIDMLRWGWGALLGGAFVAVTGLGAVAALTANADAIDPTLDRVIAALAIAGGVKGLARFKDAVNPPKKTSAKTEEQGGSVQAPPGTGAYLMGLLALAVAVAIALIFAGDEAGLDLVAPEDGADGTVGFVVRFGPLLVAAVAIEQLLERSFAAFVTGRAKKLVVASVAVVLGVIAARLMDVYLLHSIGFFGTEGADGLGRALAASTASERAFDVVVTGLVIAAGTAPLHDVATALKRAKEK